MRKSNRLVEGIGITDVAYSPVATKCPYYAVWHSMLKRCYNASFLIKNPSYAGCSVVVDWHKFSVFKEWMQKQDWQGKQLDKDIRVPGNKEYGPNTCLFVTHQINGLLNTQPNLGGTLPLGVTKYSSKYKVTLKKRGKTQHIGVFATIWAAQRAYLMAKADWIDEIAQAETCVTTRLALQNAAQRYRKGAH